MAGNFVAIKKPPIPQKILEAYRARGKKLLLRHGRNHVRRRREIAKRFQNKNRPTFRHETTENDDGLTMTVTYRDKSKKRLIWLWLSRTGTRPHKIPARKKPALIFNWGGPGSYIAKTFPGNPPFFGGPGQVVGGQIHSFRVVDHPGFPPRKFDEFINDDLEPGFRLDARKTLVRGIRDGLKK